MAIAGERPETGVRIAIERDKTLASAPFFYRGAAFLPDATFPLEVTVTATGDVAVALNSDPTTGAAAASDLSEKVRLIVRTVYKQAVANEVAPPWRIVRWRGEK